MDTYFPESETITKRLQDKRGLSYDDYQKIVEISYLQFGEPEWDLSNKDSHYNVRNWSFLVNIDNHEGITFISLKTFLNN